MSKRILQALMQLFAIIAPPASNAKDREYVVKSFLGQQLNRELVAEYLKVFEKYYTLHQRSPQSSTKRRKRTASSSVKVLKICTEINQELTQKQKFIVLIRLLEFINSDKEISAQELEFVSTVAETFYVENETFTQIKDFVTNSFNQILDSPNLLLIDNKQANSGSLMKHRRMEQLNGQIRILYIPQSEMFVMRYLGESELYLNSQPLQQDKIQVLTSGASIKSSATGAIYYADIVSEFYTGQTSTKAVLEVCNVSYRFKNGKKGLHNINFSEESGKLVGIMGSSGTGKTTLLNVLNGSLLPTRGQIMLNGFDMHRESEKLKGIVGYVSQDDLLIEELSVFENLFYNAKLCFQGLNNFQIARRVVRILKNLGLYEIKDMKVGSPLNRHISGGQRKRLNIALELIREPTVLYLDEPTSGLSSKDSDNILDLLKELTRRGKLVIVVIHQPSSDIFKMLDHLIFLDQGGYMIYDGNPVESLVYFKSSISQADWNESECPVCGNVNPEQLFNIVEAEVVDEYGNLTNTRKISPEEWNEKFETHTKDSPPPKPGYEKKVPHSTFSVPNWFSQFKVFIWRDILSKFANRQYLFVNILEAPVLAFILAYIIRYYDVTINESYALGNNNNLPVYLFMSVIIAVFIGLSVSAQEIIKDRRLLNRERFLNLSRSSYLMSKIAILFAISAFQALTYVLIGNWIIQIKGMFFGYWLVLFSTWCFANLLGLIISDSFKTSVTIYILIPFLIIPQIILSGVIVKFDKINPAISELETIPWYGEIITSRWAYEALAVYQFRDNKYQKPLFGYEQTMSNADFRKNYWLPNLQNKLSLCRRFLENKDVEPADYDNAVRVLSNEVPKELARNPQIEFTFAKKLSQQEFSLEILYALEEYFDQINHYYLKRYNRANKRRDKFISHLQRTAELRKKFLQTKREHYNASLAEFVKNVEDLDRVVEYQGHLYRKSDPVFHYPQHPFLKAHFYAPVKRFSGYYIDTFWANVLVIWAMNLVLYFILYYALLRRFLNFSERLSSRREKA